MTGKTAIAWATATWNPVTGCTRVTAGCDFCYAFALHDQRHAAYQKYGGVYPKTGKPMPHQYAQPFSAVRLLPERLEDPLRVRRPQRFFVNSMADLFHSQVPDDYIRRVFDVMRRAEWHIFQVLTKRAGRLRRLGPCLDWPPNVWMGVSIENDLLTPRADALRAVPAAVRFLSCEPLLGPLPSLKLDGLHWLIAGGESGPLARPMQESWAVDLRDRCVAVGIPYFFKQWGGRTPQSGGKLLQGQIWDQMPASYAAHQARWAGGEL